MIKYIPHHLVEKDKYDLCISQAKNSRIYAFSWYLDCVAEKWDLLMSDSYSKVMPLPRRKKYGINYIYMPSWTQQLGIFSKEVISADEVNEFLKKIPGKFVLVDYMLNASNPFNKFSFHERRNFILPLHRRFEEIVEGFNKNRKRISRRSFEGYNLEKKGNREDFLNLVEGEHIKYSISKDALDKLKQLLMKGKGHIHIWNVFKGEVCVGGLIWLKDEHRVTYLFPLVKNEAKKEHVNTFLINELIREHQDSGLVLDFEGSMISGVAGFYKSFGALEEPYHMYKKRLFTHV